jgi:hypothetical protein
VKEKTEDRRTEIDGSISSPSLSTQSKINTVPEPSKGKVKESAKKPSRRRSIKLSDEIRGVIIGGLIGLVPFLVNFLHTTQQDKLRNSLTSDENARGSAKDVREPIENRKLELFKALTDKPENAQKTLQAFEDTFSDDAKEDWFKNLKSRFQQ